MTTFLHPMAAGSYRADPRNAWRPPGRPTHRGIDYAAPAGTPIYAVGDGVVADSRSGVGGFGCWIVIDHIVNGVKVSSVYGHMYPGDLMVRRGEHVKRGQQISRVGSNGQSSGPHLHAELWRNGRLTGGHDINPAGWWSHDTSAPAGDAAHAFRAEPGQRGEHVTRLQEFMTTMFGSYNKYRPTGFYGTLTTAGIAEFQRRVQLDDDGIVGPITAAALARYGFQG